MRRKMVLILTLLMMLTQVSWAGSDGTYRTIGVYFSKITVMLNGVPLSQQRDVMLYNGMIYVPLESFSDMLGAQMRWADGNTSVSIDFAEDDRDVLFSAAQRGLYQYLLIEKQGITADLSKQLAARNWVAMKATVERISKLQEVTKQMEDDDLTKSLDKMRTSAEWIRTSYAANKVKNAKLAWVLFGDSLDQFNKTLKNRLSESADLAKKEAGITTK